MTYAWTKFKTDVDEWGQVGRWIMPGDEVSQSDIGVSDEDWKSYKDRGLVSDEPYPDIPPDVSPAEYWRANPDQAPGATSTVVEEVEVPKKAPLADVFSKKDEPKSEENK